MRPREKSYDKSTTYQIMSILSNPKPEPKNTKRADEQMPQKMSALLMLLEKALKEAARMSNENELVMTPQLAMILEQLDAMEAVLAQNPKTQQLACLLRAKIDDLVAAYTHPEVNQEETPELAPEATAGTLATELPTPKPEGEPDKKEEEDQIKAVKKEGESNDNPMKQGKFEEGVPDEDKGVVPNPFSAF